VLGEFGVGDYRREFRIGEDVHADAIAARYEAGVLTLDLPKATKAGPRRVAVTGR
jgi:HSP20 family protein